MDAHHGVVAHDRLMDDDNTFAPPALSAYTIALLSESPASASPQGIYNYDIEENTPLKNTLRSRLSVHFKDQKSVSPKSSSASRNHSVSNYSENFSNVSSVSNITNTTHMSNASVTNGSMDEKNSRNGSFDARFANAAGSGTNVGTNTVLPNSLSNLHTLPKPDIPTDSHQALVSTQVKDPEYENHSLPSLSSTLTPGYTVSRPLSSGPAMRRSRLARRFKTLGPPKRASALKLEQELREQEHREQELREKESREQDQPVKSPAETTASKHTISPKGPISSELDFFKGLNALKEAGLATPAARPSTEVSSRPPRKDFPVSVDRPQHIPPPTSDANFAYPKRPPLSEVDLNSLNKGPLDDFRKPKMPRTGPSPSLPSSVSPATRNYVPRPASHEIHQDDAKRRKLIQVNSSQYEKLELLGRGGSSKVYKVRALADKKYYAIKKVTYDQFDEACIKGFKGEIDLLNKLQHESRVVTLVEHAITEGTIFLVMECGDLDLAHVLSSRLTSDSVLDLNFVRYHAAEVLKCVQAVHNAGIVHSDLKPANFLFVRGTLKIIDFGIANAVPDHTSNIYRNSQIGTPNYMAPEALVEVNNTVPMSSKLPSITWRVGRPSDIWSCGCIIYQMIYGKPPYASYSGQQRIMAIMTPNVKIQYPSRGIGGARVPESSVILMKKCLERNPSDRWTVEQCLASDFLRPKAVNRTLISDVLHSAVNFGYNTKNSQDLTEEKYERLVDMVLQQIEELNFA